MDINVTENTNALLAKIFPAMTHFGRGGDEVNGLTKDTYPANCEILMSGQEQRAEGRRELFLVKVDGVMLWLRICTAMEGWGYDEFAVLHRIAITEKDQRTLQAYCAETIERICEPRTLN